MFKVQLGNSAALSREERAALITLEISLDIVNESSDDESSFAKQVLKRKRLSLSGRLVGYIDLRIIVPI